ncbi:T9SS type A sorting domain-containing protein [Aestuariibaculum sediminum]|uniref:T9SS type A sorting domain-containing protein n=1 Tax=Aestuariibaculum sediminum TaxID=2770637 RepID=A0A8J6PZE6_9FLAO|nr:T9SS type A sorting domain-containing protein [Aestuariibaculum sediminum]MBD0832043.1 T9SS type A sorting domain-containing protein [Aestuariibaculum sediminum]
MKQIYFLLIAFMLCVNFSFAQPCPESGGAIQNGTAIVFYYPNNSVACASMPSSITVVDNGTSVSSTFTLDTSACSSTLSSYTLNSGNDALTGQGFVVSSGFDTSCSYSGGTLPVEAFELINKELKIYPSPVVKGNIINVASAFNLSAKIEIYNITGRLVFVGNMVDAKSKDINISNLVNGLYLVKLSTEQITISKKIVISK